MNTNKDVVRYVISLALLSLFMVSVANKNQEAKIVNIYPEYAYAASTVDQMNLPKVVHMNYLFNKFQAVEQVMKPVSVVNTSVTPEPSEVADKEPIVHTYIVTAFMLNVREKGSSDSNIRSVLKQNESIEVIGDLHAQWLELKLGGFVRSTYVAKESKEGAITKPLMQVEKMEAKAIHTTEAKDEFTPESKKIIPKNKMNHVNMKSNLTASDIEKMFTGTALEGEDLGTVIIDVENTYGINALFTVAVAKLESGNGKSRISRDKNNLFGLNATDGNAYNGALKFDSKGDSVKAFGRIIFDYYLEKGLTTVSKISGKYCPANPDWTSLISSIMKGDYNKVIS